MCNSDTANQSSAVRWAAAFCPYVTKQTKTLAEFPTTLLHLRPSWAHRCCAPCPASKPAACLQLRSGGWDLASFSPSVLKMLVTHVARSELWMLWSISECFSLHCLSRCNVHCCHEALPNNCLHGQSPPCHHCHQTCCPCSPLPTPTLGSGCGALDDRHSLD